MYAELANVRRRVSAEEPFGPTSGPVIIGGSPSTGSTMLRVLLGRHPGFRSGGELNVFDQPSMFDPTEARFEDCIRMWLTSGYPRSFASIVQGVLMSHLEWGWTREELFSLAGQAETWSEYLALFFARSGEANPRTRWVEKTPGNVFGFARVLQEFDAVMFVHTVRDARDTVASLIARGFSPFRAVTRWYCAAAAGLAMRGHRRVVEVRYERLVREPEAELARICGCLGLRYDDRMLAGAEAPPVLASWHASEHGPVTSRAIGRSRSSDQELIDAHLAAVRLTDDGYRLLEAARLDDRAASSSCIPNAVELMALLGEDIRQPRRLTTFEQATIRNELSRFRVDQRTRFGSETPCCPTAV